MFQNLIRCIRNPFPILIDRYFYSKFQCIRDAFLNLLTVLLKCSAASLIMERNQLYSQSMESNRRNNFFTCTFILLLQFLIYRSRVLAKHMTRKCFFLLHILIVYRIYEKNLSIFVHLFRIILRYYNHFYTRQSCQQMEYRRIRSPPRKFILSPHFGHSG